MTEAQIIKIIQDEIKNKTWGITEQILEIHSPIFIEGEVQIANIVITENEISVFLPLQNEKFYLTFYIDSNKKEIIGISTEPNISIYFRATSENLKEKELKLLTNIQITKSWSKGDKRKFGNGIYNFTCIIIEPNIKPNNFHAKLAELIIELQKDKNGIRNLCKIADGHIQVVMEFHNGNGMIGGPILSKENIKNLSELELTIDFDFYVSGNLYKS